MRFIPLEDLIANHLETCSRGWMVLEQPRLPRHPQRGRRDRGGRGREPHPGARARAAPAALSVRRSACEIPRTWTRLTLDLLCVSSTSPSRRSTACRRRSTSGAVRDREDRPPGPPLPAPRPHDAGAVPARRAEHEARPVPRHRLARTCSCTTLTSPSRRAFRRPRAGRRRPERPWRSSRRSTARPGDSPIVEALIDGRRRGQAGPGPGRDQGAVRRAEQHHLGAQAREGRCARRLRPGRTEDALEARARHPAGGGTLKHYSHIGNRQLQPKTSRIYEGHGAVHCGRHGGQGPHPLVQRAVGLRDREEVQAPARRAAAPAQGGS